MEGLCELLDELLAGVPVVNEQDGGAPAGSSPAVAAALLPAAPAGLVYWPEALTPQEARNLAAGVGTAPWAEVGCAGSRRVQQYGAAYDYATGRVGGSAAPFPEWLEPAAKKAAELCSAGGGSRAPFTQAIVNCYEPGQGIAAHVDRPQFGPEVVCFTLGSAATLDFETGAQRFSLRPEPGSAYMMSGPSRYVWRHSQAARKSDPGEGGRREARGRRISVTFRRGVAK